MIFRHGERAPRTWLALLVVAAVVFGFRHRLPFSSVATLVTTFQDDAFYYFVIARNVAHGQGFTFDGIHATNGFQPLWLFVLVPLFRVVTDDTAALRVVALLELAIVSGAAVLFFRSIASRLGPTVACAATLVLVAQPGAPEVLRSGMESALVLLTLVAAWWLLVRVRLGETTTLASFALLGIFVALAFLARIEALVIAPLVVWSLRDRLRGRPQALAALALPPALTTGAYFLWNRIAFGGWVPVSGVVKRTWVAHLPLKDRLHRLLDVPWFGEWAFARMFGARYVFALPLALRMVYALLACTLAVLLWRFRAPIRTGLARFGGGALLVACLAISALDLAALAWIEVWQRVPLLLVVTLLLVPLLQRSRAARGIAVVAAAVCLLLPVETGYPRAGAAAECRLQAGAWLASHTRPEERIGSWNAGLIGYVAHRSVVNFDGLVNDLDYFHEVIVGKRFGGYVRRERIDWVADSVQGPDLSPRTFLARVEAESLAEQLEVRAEFADAHDPSGRTRAVVWRFRSHPAGTLR